MKDWNDVDKALREIAQIDLDVAAADAEKTQQQLDAEDEYKRETAPLIAKRGVLAAEIEKHFKQHRKEVESDGKRSIELHFGRLGMRRGNPTLKLLKGWKWEAVLSAIKEQYGQQKRLLSAIVKTKESINKDGIKSQLDEAARNAIGLQTKQTEEFFLETFPEKLRSPEAA